MLDELRCHSATGPIRLKIHARPPDRRFRNPPPLGAPGAPACGICRGHAGDGEEGLAAAKIGDDDAIVLDIMLPKLDGLAVLQQLRAAGRTHVLLLTARDTVAARVEAPCRRSYGQKEAHLRIGPLAMDISVRDVRL